MEDPRFFHDMGIPLAIAAATILEAENQEANGWTVQGFGMMRCYLDTQKIWRLNIYHSALHIPNVSVIHTHPWHFDSFIIGGELRNVQYSEATERSMFQHSGTEGEAEYEFAEIITGIASPVGDAGAGGVASQGTRWLMPKSGDGDLTHGYGDYYHMDAADIHETRYMDGTCTLNRRTKVGDGEHAIVYWPTGTDWVSAKPRNATPEEIEMVRTLALDVFYTDRQ